MRNIFRILGITLLILLIHSCTKEKPSLPVLTTTDVSSINQTTATSGGNITSDGGEAIISRGVCWSMSIEPTITGNKTIDGEGMGDFSSNITGLSPNTTYFVRAYATNSLGTAYGIAKSLTTSPSTVPVLTTTQISSITHSTAVGGGIITTDGTSSITARGICWSTTTNPTIALSTKTANELGTGALTSSITGLIAGTLYYVRAYATNGIGTAYGEELSFTTNPVSTLAIGIPYQGGKIIYILQIGDPGYIAGQTHGFIVAPFDQQTGIGNQWSNGSLTITGAIATALGTGNVNTNTIVNSQGEGSYAAKLCYDLVLRGYSDWYLPSKDELNKLYLNKAVVGDVSNSAYWSSSEINNGFAWAHYFLINSQSPYSKGGTLYLRAFRSF